MANNAYQSNYTGEEIDALLDKAKDSIIMKHLLGGEKNLAQQELHDGYIYFCHDTKNMWIDHLDENGVLVRSKVSSEYADKLRYIKDGETVEIVPENIATIQYVVDSLSDVLKNSDFSELYIDTETTLLEVLQALDSRVSKLEAYHGGSIFDRFTPTYQTYGVSIDLSNSNPETSVTYTDDAVGMVAGSPDWYKMSIFNKIKPCLFKNGAVVGYLNPDNFAQFADGTAADITSGNSGDVMIEIPKTGYKITNANNVLTVQITNDPNKDGFCYKAHTRANEGDREKLYIGAFLGSNKDSKLRSISGVSPLSATTLTDFRTRAKANGTGYDLLAFYPMTLLQCLYLIMFKNLNSQSALGQGYTGDTDWMYLQKNTGATVDKGMNYGSSDNMEQMKFLGIEDFWGNLYQWIDGLVSTSDYHALVATDNFNDTGDSYADLGALSTKYIGGYMKEPQGNNDAGFIISSTGGSSSTYFSDSADFCGGCVPVFGGFFGDGADAGAFRLYVRYYPDVAGDGVGGRLMFL